MSDFEEFVRKGDRFFHLRKWKNSEYAYLKALELDQTNQKILRNLASLYCNSGKYSQCEKILIGLLNSNPNDFVALNIYASLLCVLGNYEAALEYSLKSVNLNHQYTNSLIMLGNIYWMLDQSNKSISILEKALSINPCLSNPYNTLGAIYHSKSQFLKAKSAYMDAIRNDKSNTQAIINLSCLELLLGNYPEGYSLLEEWEKLTMVNKPLNMSLKQRWSKYSKICRQDSLLLVSGDGLGDSIQYLRYASILEKLSINYALCVDQKLHNLIQTSFPNIRLHQRRDCINYNYTKWLSLRSLPAKFNVTFGQSKSDPPYIKSPQKSLLLWKNRLAKVDKPIIAINWQGSRKNEINCLRGRSLPLELLSPIAKNQTYELLSLQKGYGSEQLDKVSFRNRFVYCQEAIDQAMDFVDVACIIQNCSLVITTDTVTAHLSGALGKKTWLLLQHVPDWRWGLVGENTFWYPSIRIFRQTKPGNWQDVIQKVLLELSRISTRS